MTRLRLALLGAAVLVLVAAATIAVVVGDDRPDAGEASLDRLRVATGVDEVERHLGAFARIALAHDGNRAAGTGGYRASVRYVVRALEAAGYDPAVQRFTFTAYREPSPPRLTLAGRPAPRGSFKAMLFSPPGRAAGELRRVGGSSPGFAGCAPGDFAGLVPGSVALVPAAGCTYAEQAANAEAGGAAALLASRPVEGGAGLLRGSLGDDAGVDIPVLVITQRLARSLAGGTDVEVAVGGRAEEAVGHNVIAQTGSGTAPVVMLGAHLDSVIDGPGINDNATGSAVLLALAEGVADENLRHRVRFAWWGAEEYGLIGSLHYVDGLTEREAEAVGAYLNLDMVGSPNFVRYVYEGEREPDGSEAIEELLRSWFEARGLETETIPLEGRSDHAGFAARGIPVGGLFTGADMMKTEDEVEDYGGEAGAWEDPCYHLVCDDLGNVDRTVLGEMVAAIAHAVAVMATTPGVVP